MRTIITATVLFALAALCIGEAAWAGVGEVGRGSVMGAVTGQGSLLFPHLGLTAAIVRKSTGGKSRDEQPSAVPSKSIRPPTRSKFTPPARKPAAPRSTPAVSVSRPKPRAVTRTTRPVSRPVSRTTPRTVTTRPAPTRRVTTSRPATPTRATSTPRTSTPSTRPSTTWTSARTTSRPSVTPGQVSIRRPTSTTSTAGSRPRTTWSSTTTRSGRTGSTTGSRSGSPSYTRQPGTVARGTVVSPSSSRYTRGGVTNRASGPYVTSRFSRGAGDVSSRFSRGSAGSGVTSRFSRGHAGSYVTSRYSRGHATGYVTSRYSRGNARTYVTGRYSTGRTSVTSPSRWYYRAQRGRSYSRYYHYYGRGSRYYFGHGRWIPLPPGHIHGPQCGHLFQYGRWVAMGALGYPVYVPVPVIESPYYYEGGWHSEAPIYLEEGRIVAPATEEYEPIQGNDYVSIGTKAEREFAMISRTYDLDWWQAKRVEDLISNGVIDSVLAGGEGGEESRIVYDKTKQRLTVTATPDDIMRVRTIIDDDRTYKLFSLEDLGGLVVDAVPLVDLRFIEADSSSALRIAADNYSAADEILRSSGATPAGREWWFNDSLGTMTVRNSVENLDSLYEFMETRPYIQ